MRAGPRVPGLRRRSIQEFAFRSATSCGQLAPRVNESTAWLMYDRPVQTTKSTTVHVGKSPRSSFGVGRFGDAAIRREPSARIIENEPNNYNCSTRSRMTLSGFSPKPTPESDARPLGRRSLSSGYGLFCVCASDFE